MSDGADLGRSLKELAESSLFFFCKVVLGYSDLTPDFHGHFCSYMESPKRFKLIVGPRGHLKTSICTIGYALWRALKNPELRILITANTATNSSKMLRTIKKLVESRPLIRALWPEAVPDVGATKWTEEELEFRRQGVYSESTIESMGRSTVGASRHYDILISDDLLAPEDGTDVSGDLVDKAITSHKYSSGLMISPATSEQVVSATRWLYDDYIAYLFENEKWFLPCLYFGAYRDDGTPWWPERFPADELDRLLDQQGPRIFSTQYLNNPSHEDTRSFDRTWERFFSHYPPINDRGEPQPVVCITAIDPAYTQKGRSDYTAIVTVGTDLLRNRYVVDARQGRWGTDEWIDNLFEVYRIYRPVRVGLESILGQSALLFPIKEAMRREGVVLPMYEMKGGFSRLKKAERIKSLHEFFANGSIWLNADHTELLKQLRGWPNVKHDDLLDALAYAMRMLVYPQEKKGYTYHNPLTFETMLRELRARRTAGRGPFTYAGEGSFTPVGFGSRLPQSPQEVYDLMEEMRRGG